MRAYNLFTEEIDFVDDAVAELKAEYDKKVGPEGLLAHTAAVIYTDSLLDISAFIEEFRRVFPFPAVGCSGMTMFDRSNGVCKSGICVLLMTADDIEFASSISEKLEPDTVEKELRRAYENGLIALGKTPGLIIFYGDTTGLCPGDDLVETMNRITGNVTLFGGLSAPALDTEVSFAFTDKGAGGGRVGLLFMYGEGLKNALYRYELSVEDTNICSGTVTKNVYDWAVGEINGRSLLDNLKRSGIENGAEGTNYNLKYISSPFFVTREMENGDKTCVLRNIIGMDTSIGAGYFAGRIPAGAHVSMGAMSKERVAESSKKAFESLLETAKERGLHPTAFLCVSCKARYFNLSADRREEVNAYDQVIDKDAALIGYYSQGEICPVASSTGGFFNLYHNSTIAILAL